MLFLIFIFLKKSYIESKFICLSITEIVCFCVNCLLFHFFYLCLFLMYLSPHTASDTYITKNAFIFSDVDMDSNTHKTETHFNE